MSKEEQILMARDAFFLGFGTGHATGTNKVLKTKDHERAKVVWETKVLPLLLERIATAEGSKQSTLVEV